MEEQCLGSKRALLRAREASLALWGNLSDDAPWRNASALCLKSQRIRRQSVHRPHPAGVLIPFRG